ncbi:MAG: gamma carbonic anhydrase family protein [Longimicrobiales bacterium]
MAVLIPFRGKVPTAHPTAFLAPTAVLVGNVTVGPEASVWFGAVLRGDHAEHGVVVGARTSIQDNCVVHVGTWGPTLVGEDVTVGHGAKFESCTIGDRTVVGMNAVILPSAVVGEECVLAANTVVLEGARIPPRSMVAGVPGKVKKAVDGSAAEWIARGSRHYVGLSRDYLAAGVERADTAPQRCERCGGEMLERHCKLVCVLCGYQRDCSDP